MSIKRGHELFSRRITDMGSPREEALPCNTLGEPTQSAPQAVPWARKYPRRQRRTGHLPPVKQVSPRLASTAPPPGDAMSSCTPVASGFPRPLSEVKRVSEHPTPLHEQPEPWETPGCQGSWRAIGAAGLGRGFWFPGFPTIHPLFPSRCVYARFSGSPSPISTEPRAVKVSSLSPATSSPRLPECARRLRPSSKVRPLAAGEQTGTETPAAGLRHGPVIRPC